MPKLTSPTKSKSYISTSSSGSDSDSSHSSSATSVSKKSKNSVIVRPKSRSPPPLIPPVKIPPVKEEPPSSPLKPTELPNSNGLQKTNLHDEHVAILDKLSSNMREELKRGLGLLNTCVNELAQTKWILVNVERTLDEFYQECPVCRSADDDGAGRGPGDAAARPEKSVPDKETPKIESDIKDKTGDSHGHDSDSDGEKKRSHKLPPMPMGRSGCNFSKHSTSTKYKHKEKKVSSKESTKTKTEPIKTSPPVKKEFKSQPTKVPETPNKTVAPVPAKYKAGPRSKTRPLENPSEQPVASGSAKSSPPAAETPTPPIPTIRTDAEIKYLRALIMEGSSVKVNLKNVSYQLNGRTRIKDWRKLDQKEEDDVESNVSKRVSSTQKSKTYKAVSSDSDEDQALIKLKRKREEVSEKSSKRHKSSSHSHSRSHSHHSKDKYKHSSEKDKSGGSSKDKHSKIKSADSIKRDRKSVDSHSHSHSSGKERKSIDSLPGSKHRKSEDSGSVRRDSKSSEHKEKDEKHLKRDSESKIQKLSDPGSEDHKAISEVSVKSTNEPPKITKSEEIVPVVNKVVAENISSQPEPEKVNPVPLPAPAPVVAAATVQKVPVASKAEIFKLLQEKFQKFNQSKNQNLQKPPEVQPAPVPVSTSSEVAPQETESSKTTDPVPSTSNLADGDLNDADAKSTKSDPSTTLMPARRPESQVEVSTTQEIEKETAPTVEAKEVDNVEICGDKVSSINSAKEHLNSEIKATVSEEAEISSTDNHSLVLAQDDPMEIKDNTFKEILQSLDLDGI